MDWNEARFKSVGLLGRGLIGTYFALVRCVREGSENYLQFRDAGEPVVFVFWHGQLLSLVHYHRHEGIVVLTSEHKDGEYITRVIRRHGFGAVRGSSTRGGARAVRRLVREAQAGKDLAFTPDGPRGPRHEFKQGAVITAQLSGLPIIPLGVGAEDPWYLDSWDRFMIPKPFSSIRIKYNPPRWVPRDATEEDRERIATELGQELKKITLDLNPKEPDLQGETDATK